MRPSPRASPQRSVSFAAAPGSAYSVAWRSMAPACALTSTGPSRGPSVTSTWTRPLESVTTRAAPNHPFGRQRESGEQPDEIGLAQPLTAPPLRGPRRCREQEEERGGTRDRHHYGRAHPDCSNLRSTESTPAYSA